MAAKQEPQWMTQPRAPLGCPPGLEYLTQIDQLLVQQQVELLESSLICVTLKCLRLSSPLKLSVDWMRDEEQVSCAQFRWTTDLFRSRRYKASFLLCEYLKLTWRVIKLSFYF